MAELAMSLPCRRIELICWPARGKGQYLIRNRRTGETFEFGEEERFLLSRLDGRQTSDDICREFQGCFGQQLSAEELQAFVHLARDRGLLQSADAIPGAGTLATAVGPLEVAPRARAVRSLGKRSASRLVRWGSALLQWPARTLSAAAGGLDMFRLKHLDFVPRPDDIFIVSYPRSGTTWLQMILFQLTQEGSVDFAHIAEYCPWFERSRRSAQAFETRPSPRIFKSHLSFRKIPKGAGRYIYVARDGKDVALSYYHLYRMYNGYEGTFNDFFDRFVRGKVGYGSWFRHVDGWWSRRHDPSILFLTYEELCRNLEGSIRRIAAFIGHEVSPEKLPMVLQRCSFQFMKQHESRFDPALEVLWEQGIQLRSFFRKGRVGEGAVHLSSAQRARFDEALRNHWRGTASPWPLVDGPPE
jgi:hypothetical protein